SRLRPIARARRAGPAARWSGRAVCPRRAEVDRCRPMSSSDFPFVLRCQWYRLSCRDRERRLSRVAVRCGRPPPIREGRGPDATAEGDVAVLIAVTGGTGYLGAHTVAALLAEGHAVRLLVHPSEDVAAALTLFAAHADRIETVTGDIRDQEVVATLLAGCDALLHAAGIVGTDDRREALMWEVNVEATGRILAEATKLGLDPIVHVASYSALFPCPDPVITPDSPTAPGRSAYGRTKSTADRIARALQAAGAPVVITYPSSVVGPALGPQAG